MWKVSGNGMAKPSYLYGTMHISGKMAFLLGDPFYNAMKQVDIVALELEPDEWLESLYREKKQSFNAMSSSRWKNDYGLGLSNSIPPLKGFYVLNADIQEIVMDNLMATPPLLNHLLFRYGQYAPSADYEEDTWLDMYIYQVGKKLGKKTMGLETYNQSMFFFRKMRAEGYAETSDNDEQYDNLINLYEPAYRKEDLDLIDSIERKNNNKAFYKYILVERNKIFVHNLDSTMRSGKTVFAGMGCAHLPGEEGVIEMLRNMGYQVEAYNKGEHGGKQRNKIESQFFKSTYKTFKTKDGFLSFASPSTVYQLQGDKNSKSWLSLDIPNNASFLVTSIRNFAGLNELSSGDQMASIDSILYESIAGVVVSKKKILIQGHPGFDIINKTRRGDFHRRQIIILPENILILQLSTNGEKVRKGFGDEFFNSVKINMPLISSMQRYTSPDGMVSMALPSARFENIFIPDDDEPISDFIVTAFNSDSGNFYAAQKHTLLDPGFIDEDVYELNRLANAFKADNMLSEISRTTSVHHGLPALKVSFTNQKKKTFQCLFILQNLNYWAFTIATKDSTSADSYFQSIRFSMPTYDRFYSHEDTTCHFKVALPYTYSSTLNEDEEWNWFFSDWDKSKNIFYGKNASTTLYDSISSDLINVKFQRYQRFSDGDDSIAFINNREQYVIQGLYKIERRNITWNKTGVVMEYVLADSSSIRKKWVKQILFNKSLYVIETNYDAVLGPCDFAKMVFQTFEPTDTIFPYYHFTNMDNQFLNALTSTDSTVQVNARAMISEVDFSAPVADRIIEILKDLPPAIDNEQRADIKENLTYGLQYDTSLTTIRFIEDEYYRNMDSAYYQMDLLRTLLLMKNKNAVLAFKKLILDEPPLMYAYNNNDVFELLQDSLSLGKILLPEIWSLVSLNEYENSVIKLTGKLIDSALVSPSFLEQHLPQLLLQAKNELKRQNTVEKEDETTINRLLNYCYLLQPFRKNRDVTAFFKKAYQSKKTNLLLSLAEFDLQHHVLVEDTVFKRIAEREDKLCSLYEMMYRQKIADRFPIQQQPKETLLKAHINEVYRSKHDRVFKIDSIQSRLAKQIDIRGDILDIYYCKYKRSDSKQWRSVIIAFDAKDNENLWPQRIEYGGMTLSDNLANHDSEMDEMLEKLIERNRKKRKYTKMEGTYDFDVY